MSLRGDALAHIAAMKSRFGRGYHPGYLALVDDYGFALSVVDAAEVFLEIPLVVKMGTTDVTEAFTDLQRAVKEYHENQGE